MRGHRSMRLIRLSGHIVPINHDVAIFDTNLDDLIDGGFAVSQLIENRLEQEFLQGGPYLGDNDDQPGMQPLAGIEFAKIGCIVGDECKIVLDDARHEMPVGLATKAKPDNMMAFMAVLDSDFGQRGMKAFIDQKFHRDEVALDRATVS